MQLIKSLGFWGRVALCALAMLFVFGVVVACTFTYPSFERIQGFSVSGEQGERLTASASIEVANDWIVPITAHDLHFSIGYGGQVFAQGKVNESILLKSKAATAITAQTSLDLGVLHSLWKELLTKDTIECEVIVNGFFTPFKIKAKKTQKIALPVKDVLDLFVQEFMRGDGLQIKDIMLESTKLTQMTWAYTLAFRNDFPIDLHIKEVYTEIYSSASSKNKKPLAKGYLLDPIDIPKGETEHIEGNIVIQTIGLLGGVLDKVKNPSPMMYVKCKVVVELGGYEFPMPIEGKVLYNMSSKSIQIIE